MPRICASTCKSEYQVTDTDLARLDVEYAPNPHYPTAARMRLYNRKDVKKLAAIVEAERPAREALREQLKLEKQEHRADAAAQLKEDAVEMMARWQPPEILDKPEDAPAFALPLDVLVIVMRLVADSLEPDGVVGPSITARTLCNIAATCKDFRAASSAGFQRLAESVQLPQKLPAGVDWVQLLSDPMGCKGEVLKAAARSLHLTVSGIKAEVAHRILSTFALSAYPAAAAYPNAIAAVAAERVATEATPRLWQALSQLRNLRSAAEDPLFFALQSGARLCVLRARTAGASLTWRRALRRTLPIPPGHQ